MVYSKFLEEIIYTIYVTVQILFLYIILNYLQMIYTILNENSSINDFIYFVNTHYLLLGVFLKGENNVPLFKDYSRLHIWTSIKGYLGEQFILNLHHRPHMQSNAHLFFYVAFNSTYLNIFTFQMS